MQMSMALHKQSSLGRVGLIYLHCVQLGVCTHVCVINTNFPMYPGSSNFYVCGSTVM